jgi:hypothetical protein
MRVRGLLISLVKAQIVSSLRVGLLVIWIFAGQCFLPRPNCRIYNLSLSSPGEVLIKACCHFYSSYSWKMVIIDL